MRPNSGKLMLPGSKIVWDMHYHAVGEEITDARRARRLLLPEGPGAEAPRGARTLRWVRGTNARRLDIPPNTVTTTESFVVAEARTRASRTSRRTCTCAARRMSMEAIFPTASAQMLSQVSDFNFNWHQQYIYADDAAPLLPKGTILHFARVVRQHDGQQEQSRSGSVGRLRRSHGRRDGPRVGQHHLHERRRLQGGARGAPRAPSPPSVRRSSNSSRPARPRPSFDSLAEAPSRPPGRRLFPSGAGSMNRFRVAVATARCWSSPSAAGGSSARASTLSSPRRCRAPPPAGSRACRRFPPSKAGARLKDGTNAVQIGYYNRNKEQVIDVPDRSEQPD